MHKRFLEHVKKHFSLGKKDTVILGISGGPDSVCLLILLEKIKKALGFKLILVHVNYHLRKESSKDEKLVSKYAKKYREKLYVLNSHQEKKDEATLRDIRYRFLRTIKKKEGGTVIATAHTQDDNIETMLLFLLRGSGLQGLAGIKPKQEDLIRPLLLTSKKEIVAYLKRNHFPFRIDKTNQQKNYTRNKIRNKLVPYLEKNFNPNIKKTFSKTNFHLTNDFDFISKKAKNALNQLLVKENKDSCLIDYKKWQKLHSSMQFHVLRLAVKKLRTNLIDFKAITFLEIVAFLHKPEEKKNRSFLKRLQVSTSHDKIRLSF